jgi:hypothetical protein
MERESGELHDARLERLPALHYALSMLLALATVLWSLPIALGWRTIVLAERYGQADLPAPSLSGWVFLLLGALSVVAGLLLAAGLAVAGRRIRRRRSHGFCLLVAALVTFFFPLGTLLGFHAIDVLTSPPARRAFGVVAAGDLAA